MFCGLSLVVAAADEGGVFWGEVDLLLEFEDGLLLVIYLGLQLQQLMDMLLLFLLYDVLETLSLRQRETDAAACFLPFLIVSAFD